MQKIELPFGRTGIEISVPDSARIYGLKNAAPLPSSFSDIAGFIEHPFGSERLADIAKKKRYGSACVVVSDHTRPVPNSIVLPPVLKTLENAGIDRGRITILIATGMHRQPSHAEKQELLGNAILENYNVVAHDCREEGNLLFYDIKGVQAGVNAFYCKSDLKILIGFIEPHFMAGFSGGRKTVCPGLSGRATVRHFHSPALLESPFAKTGIIKNNPCHEFALAVARTVGADFMINVTLNRNKEITGVFCGDIESAHEKGVEVCRKQSRVVFENQADIVITTNGGYPLDRDFYQTVKGLVSAMDMVKEGGVIICASECCDGVGSDDFKKLLSACDNPENFIRMISQPGYFHMDQWEVEELAKVLKKARIMLYSTCLSDADIKLCRTQPVRSIEEAIATETKRLGKNPEISVLPDGPYALVEKKK